MIRLAIEVEGQTEVEFVKEVLADCLIEQGIDVRPVLLGGSVTVDRLAREMANLRHSFDYVTSLVDFYGFRGTQPGGAVEELEERIDAQLDHLIGVTRDRSRVFAYVQRYEFEGLLFSNVDAFRALPEASVGGIEILHGIRTDLAPEMINDMRDTSPSRRIANAVPGYSKKTWGPLIALEIGLDTIRAECPRFNSWVSCLEAIGDA